MNKNSRINFVVDTGCDFTSIDTVVAKKLGVDFAKGKAIPFAGVGDADDQMVQQTKKIELSLGDKSLFKGAVLILDLQAISSLLKVNIGGILCYDVLQKRPFTLDFASRELRFESTMISSGTSTILKMLHTRTPSKLPVLQLELVVAGKFIGSSLIQIDTGSQREVLFSAQFVREHSLDKIAVWDDSYGTGIGGSHAVLHGNPGVLSSKDFRVEIADVSLNKAAKGVTATNASGEGYLGCGAMRKYAVHFDDKRDVVIFTEVNTLTSQDSQ